MKYYIIKFKSNIYTLEYNKNYLVKCKDELLNGADYDVLINFNHQSDWYPVTIQKCITTKAAKHISYNLNNIKEIIDYELVRDNKPISNIRQVYFNKDKLTTTILWKDGEYTTVKCNKNDKWDEEKAIALCYMKKYFNNRSCYNEIFKQWIQE